jgi:hypothetical protein
MLISSICSFPKLIRGGKKGERFLLLDNLTPKRVAMIRTIPVIQARVILTKATSAMVPLLGVFVSSNQRADGWEVSTTSSTVSDSDAGAVLKKITPAI